MREIDEKCIIDGGSLANFPINYCLRDHINKDEILCINFIYSNSDGSTLVSSSNDAQLFGLGALDETVYLSSSLAFTYREANTAVDTATSSSQSVINLTGTAPQSSGNFQKNKINSANPAVIPAGFQDGKFAEVEYIWEATRTTG